MVKARENQVAHNVHHYLVVGRARPSERNPNPKIYKMRIFADDVIRAKSKFWYFLKRLNKVKKTTGEILSATEVNKFLIVRFSKKTPLKLKPTELSALTNPNSDITHYTRSSEVLP